MQDRHVYVSQHQERHEQERGDMNDPCQQHAVEEGRLVYRNLKKVILYLVATSMAEVLVLLSALLFGYPLPLAAVQILWINIVTEVYLKNMIRTVFIRRTALKTISGCTFGSIFFLEIIQTAKR